MQGTHQGGEPWGASTPLSPGSLCHCGTDFCYLLTIKVLRDALCGSALGGGGGSCVRRAASLWSQDSVGILPLRSCPSWLLLQQDRAALALAEPKVPRPELLLNAAQATAAPQAVSRMGL